MKITKSEVNGVVIIAIDGEITLNSSPELHELFNKLNDQKIKKVVVDLQKTSYIDSSGIATLLLMFQGLRDKQGQLFLANIISDKIKGILEITKLDKVFKVYPSIEEALAAF